MSDTVFKTKVEPATPVGAPQAKEPSRDGQAPVEVPYLDYQMDHGKPFVVDYFGLGSTWAELQGGFPEEVESINQFIESKIKSGELPNNIKSVKDYLGRIEKLINIKDEPRAVIKIETIADYVKFLKATDERRTNIRRLYG